MQIGATILVILVAVEAILFMILEIWGSTEMLKKAFGMSSEFLKQSEARVALANQGIYNGFIGGGLLFARFDFPVNAQVIGSLLFTSFVVLAGIFGMATIRRKSVFWIQAFPAILAVLAILFNF
ncbi:DUF1304 domain-containing protein [Lentilactobacillus senioris]|uniref:DUF1304 domain-containing protein n=1 Tax=Lentilactobacillus senioris TaxID=931534 RepID=UPI0022812438|nr:DUF1304 domain-containing protein [Lentilactobacillus senioris]MCY9806161.1 DUF1304 domain-containing protein [Lentilactobacillus senioris]